MTRLCKILPIVLALGSVAWAQRHTPAPPPEVLTRFHLRTPALAARERIYGIEIHTDGAEFVSVSGMPTDWTLLIENAGDWRSSFSGKCHHGGSALDGQQLSALGFKVRLDPMIAPFQVSGQLHIVNEVTMKERTVPVTGNDLISDDPKLLVTAPDSRSTSPRKVIAFISFA